MRKNYERVLNDERGEITMVDNVNNDNTYKSSYLIGKSKMIVLALQHLIAMFGATVLVPILTGFDPSIALLYKR